MRRAHEPFGAFSNAEPSVFLALLGIHIIAVAAHLLRRARAPKAAISAAARKTNLIVRSEIHQAICVDAQAAPRRRTFTRMRIDGAVLISLTGEGAKAGSAISLRVSA